MLNIHVETVNNIITNSATYEILKTNINSIQYKSVNSPEIYDSLSTSKLKAIDFEPRFIINIRLLKNNSIKRSYIIFMLFQLYISLIFYGTRPLIEFSETNISKKDFNKMVAHLVATRRTNPCLRNLYHYLGLLRVDNFLYNTMMAKPIDEAVAFTKELIKNQIEALPQKIDTSFLDDNTASTQITQGAGKRRTKKRRSPK
jgi:hypothetical protein